MNPDLGDLHVGAPGEAGERFAADTLEGFRRLGVRVVVIGGTAMRILGSPLPSIDLDCLIHESEWGRYDVHDFIAARSQVHKAAYADSYLEVQAMEWPNKVWGSSAAYRPIDVLAKTGTDRRMVVLSGRKIEIEVPTVTGLLLMKAKALCNRAAKLRYSRDPIARAALFPETLEVIEGVPPEFFLRKAGKDLVDVTMLVELGGNLAEMAEHAAKFGIRDAMRSGWFEVQQDVIDTAEGLMVRHAMRGEPKRVLAELRESLA